MNDLEKSVLIAEVKRKKENISLSELQEKAKNLQAQIKKYSAEFKGFFMEYL